MGGGLDLWMERRNFIVGRDGEGRRCDAVLIAFEDDLHDRRTILDRQGKVAHVRLFGQSIHARRARDLLLAGVADEDISGV